MAHNIINFIIYWDQVVWFYLNTQWHTPLLDTVLPFLRNQWFWTPLYFFLALYMPSRFGRQGWFWCLAFIVTFSLSDQISAHLMKPYFQRVRPCNNPYLAGIIHLIVPCGGGYSFPSSHASNHFSLGVFTAVTLGRYVRWLWPAALFWALIVSFSQVYVGVHYPLDVTCGGLLGIMVGLCTGKIFNRNFPLSSAPQVPGPSPAV